ncbi:trypsin-like serine peptidase [Marinifilum breve]|nr:trypsin-like peptidase domain-containing protein [Marinifilum breve]
MIRAYILLACVVAFVTLKSQAQILTRYNTLTERLQVNSTERYSNNIPIIIMPNFDIEKLVEEDELVKGADIPYRFGKAFNTNINTQDGYWEENKDQRYYRIKVKSPEAFSLNFIFKEIKLITDAELYIYNKDRTVMYGPITSLQNTKNGSFLSDLIPGEEVLIELIEPSASQNRSTFKIEKVIHGYKNVLSKNGEKSLGSAGNCNLDVNCYPDWENESNAVALVLLSSGIELCTGSLLNNTAEDLKPYFLSAFHCIDLDKNKFLSETEKGNTENWMFRFHFKTSSCNSSSLATTITYNKADFKAAWEESDFALVELRNSLENEIDFIWLGWDRSGNTPSEGVCIHHPSGDLMKIAFDNDILRETEYYGNSGNSHWKVNWNDGVTEGGSSGSPLFNQSKRVVGQLHGGQASCSSSDLRDWYGCFHVSWSGGNTNSTRLSNWLDPINSGVMVLDSRGVSKVEGSNLICVSGGLFSLDNLPTNTSVTWTSSSNITFPSGNTGASVTAKASSSTVSGTGWIEATLNNSSGDVTLPRKEVWVGRPSFSLTGTTNLDVGAPGIVFVGYSSGDHFSQGIQNSNWSFTGPLDYINGDETKAQFRASRREGGIGFIYSTQTNQCGSIENRLFYEVEEPFFMLASPNPANEYTELNFYTGDEISEYQKSSPVMVSIPSNKKSNELGEYEIQIWHERKGLVKQMKSKSKKLQIPTNKLDEGIYFLHLIVNGKVHKQQLKIQR